MTVASDPARARAARADRRRHRRQRRDRARDRPAGARRRRRGHPHRPQPGAPRAAPRARSARAAARPSTPPTRTASRSSSADLPAPIDHVMVTAGRPVLRAAGRVRLRARRSASVDEHLWLALRVARDAVGRVRPGGTLLFMGGTGGRRPAVGLAVVGGAHRGDCRRSSPTWRSSSRRCGSTSSPPASSTRRLSAALLGDQLDARREQLRATLPIGRVVGPADVAALAVHLMANTALTGATYDIDGGQQLL